MDMPASNRLKYLARARCTLISFVEARALRRETGRALMQWLFQDLLCRWGCVTEIVTDNGTPWIKALDNLAKNYGIRHIRISGNNSRANGLIERPHFDMRQALFKAANGDQSKWSQYLHHVLWADHITIRRRLGCSPYFAATASHPVLPLDIAEATYLVPAPDSLISSEDLIGARARALARRQSDLSRIHSQVYAARIEAARKLERDHAASIHDYDLRRGALVLVRNTTIDKSLNRKMRPRYLGPYVVLSRNRGGAYIVAEIDGSVLDRPIAAFRFLPYLARTHIDIQWLDDASIFDITTARLREMEASSSQGDDDDDDSSHDLKQTTTTTQNDDEEVGEECGGVQVQ